MRLTALSLALLLSVGCTINKNPLSASQAPDSQHMAVTIKGKVVDASGLGCRHIPVIIFGTNFIAYTDSSGNYTFYNVPEGTYELSIGDTSISIQIEAGDTAVVPTVIHTSPLNIDDAATDSSSDSIAVTDAFVYDCRTDMLLKDLASLEKCRLFFSNAKTIQLKFNIATCLHADYRMQYNNVEKPVRVLHNGSPVYDTIPVKGRAETECIDRVGIDTFTIMIDGMLKMRFCILDSSSLSQSYVNYALITTGKNLLVNDYYSHTLPFIALDGDTFWIRHEQTEYIDWDIYFVNIANNDTCYWRNRNPDWGVKGDDADNPSFSGNTYQRMIGLDDQLYTYYQSDCVEALNLPNGTYRVMVRYFDGPSDSATATPKLNIGVGRSILTNGLVNFYTISPDRAMALGETWLAGIVSFPGKTFDPRNQQIYSAAK